MAYFDRWDICEAYYQYFCHYHSGQWSKEYARLSRLSSYYNPSVLGITLTDNGQEIYLQLVRKHNAHLAS